MPNTKYNGGRLIQHAEVTAIYWGSKSGGPKSEWETDPTLRAMACKLDDFLDDILNSAYLDQFGQYSTGPFKIGRGRRLAKG
jgi:hypothetical protein